MEFVRAGRDGTYRPRDNEALSSWKENCNARNAHALNGGT